MKINNDTKEVIENNDMELTDEELDQVAGGINLVKGVLTDNKPGSDFDKIVFTDKALI